MNKSLIKNAFFNVIYKVLNIIFPLISSTYVSRVLLPEGVGKVAYAQNIVSYFVLFAALGIPTYGVREIAQCRDDKKQTNKTFSELMIINFVSTLVCIIGYVIFALIFIKNDRELYVVCGFSLIFNFINLDWFYQGKEEYVYIAVRSSIIKLISIVMLFILVNDRSDYVAYALITCLATGGNYIFNLIHSRKYVKFTISGLKFKKHFKPIGYLIICSIAAELYGKVDVTVLGIKCTDDVVGLYSNAQKLVTLVLTLTTAISSIFLPRISYYYKNDRRQYNEYVSLGLKIVSFISIPSCLGIILISHNLTPLMFGEAFMPAAFTIQILSALIIIKSFGDILCYQVIISSGNENKLIKSYLLAAAVNIGLNLVLISAFQQNGAAIASVTSELVVNVTLLFVSLKIVKLNVDRKFFRSIIAATLGMGAVILLLENLLTNRFAAVFVECTVGVIIYTTINMLMKNEIMYMMINKIKSRLHI